MAGPLTFSQADVRDLGNLRAAEALLTVQRNRAQHDGLSQRLPVFDAALGAVREQIRAAERLQALQRQERGRFHPTQVLNNPGCEATRLHAGYQPTMALTQLGGA